MYSERKIYDRTDGMEERQKPQHLGGKRCQADRKDIHHQLNLQMKISA